MRVRALMGIGFSCLLAACAHQGDGGAHGGMAWSLHHAEGEGAKLAYGQPASDNVLLMMTCQPRSGSVLVSLTTPAGAAPQAIELASKGQASRLVGALAPGMGDGAIIEAKTSAADPTLRNFARTGDLSVVEAGRTTKVPAGRAERAAVSDFFQQCQSA